MFIISTISMLGLSLSGGAGFFKTYGSYFFFLMGECFLNAVCYFMSKFGVYSTLLFFADVGPIYSSSSL